MAGEGLSGRILSAHGGAERWRRVDRAFACATLGGWEFIVHMHPAPVRDAEVSVSTAPAGGVISPLGSIDQAGHFGIERVWIEAADGSCLAERDDPLSAARGLRQWFWWDRLDVVFQSGALIWFALVLPAVLARDDVHIEELGRRSVDGQRLDRMRLALPPALGLYGTEHVIYADATGIIRRVDSRPPLHSGMMVAQLLTHVDNVDGLVIANSREYFPCLPNGQRWQAARLAWLHLDDIRLSEQGQ